MDKKKSHSLHSKSKRIYFISQYPSIVFLVHLAFLTLAAFNLIRWSNEKQENSILKIRWITIAPRFVASNVIYRRNGPQNRIGKSGRNFVTFRSMKIGNKTYSISHISIDSLLFWKGFCAFVILHCFIEHPLSFLSFVPFWTYGKLCQFKIRVHKQEDHSF